jgi:hypothetical protein
VPLNTKSVSEFSPFQALFGDRGSSTIHKMALMKMIKAKGGLKHLALGTFLSELNTVCVFPNIIHS